MGDKDDDPFEGESSTAPLKEAATSLTLPVPAETGEGSKRGSHKKKNKKDKDKEREKDKDEAHERVSSLLPPLLSR